MPEDIGHFKVVIEGEVSPKLGDALEKGLKKSSEKVGDNLKKEIEKAIDKTSLGRFIEKGKQFAQKIADTFSGGKTSSLASDVGTGASEGAAAGGGQGALAGGLMALAAKISIGIGLIGMVLKALEGLAPIQAMIKMLVAILQITLYPIVQFFLSIFKPIIVMLLKYLILPFYYKVMPILEMLGKWLGGMLTGAVKAIEESPVGQTISMISDASIASLNNLVATIVGIMTIITSIITMTWENIITLITNSLLVIATLIGGVWNAICIVTDTAMKVIVALFTGKWGDIPGILSEGWEKIKTNLSTTLTTIKTLISNTWEKIKTNILEHIEGIKKTIIDTWDKIKTNIKETLDKIYTHIENIFGVDIVKKVKEIFNGIYNAITDPISGIISWIRTKISELLGGGSSGSSGHNYTNRMAEGGIVNSPTVALIGEAGPEAIVPLSKLNSMGNTIIVNNTFNDTRISDSRDIDKIVKEIERTFYTNSKRAGIR